MCAFPITSSLPTVLQTAAQHTALMLAVASPIQGAQTLLSGSSSLKPQ